MVTIFVNKDNYKKFIVTGRSVILHINEHEDEIDGTTYITADEFFIRLLHDDDDRGRIISATIKAKYPLDKMDAIRNNYELVRDNNAGYKTEEYTLQYLEMQEWRAYAKEYADEIMESIS